MRVNYITTMPRRPPQSVAQLVYTNGASEPSFAYIEGTHGRFEMTGAQWRLLQLLQRSSSRFV